MRVHLIKRQIIEAYVATQARSRTGFAAFLTALRYADWQVPADMKATFGSADLLGGGSNRVVFDIAGNHYRLICQCAFSERQVHLYVRWLGTHAEYTKLCQQHAQYTI